MLEARRATLARGLKTVVRDTDLVVAPGEIVALVGPNGAGKSSLLAALAGELRPRSGAILIDGDPVASLRAAALALRRAVLEQDPLLAAPFTVSELTALGAPRALPPARVAEIVADTLAELGLADLAARPVAALSGGQRHRAHLARALAQLRAGRALGAGRYLLLDEPTASLDLAFRIAAMQAARAAADAGAGVLVVLHDLDLAAAFADRVALMAAGRVVADGPPGRVLTEARLASVYGTPVRVIADSVAGLRVLPLYPPRSQPSPEIAAHVHRHEPLSRVSGAGQRL